MATDVKQIIVDILVKKITSGGINPITLEPFKIEDIKKQEYVNAVEPLLLE